MCESKSERVNPRFSDDERILPTSGPCQLPVEHDAGWFERFVPRPVDCLSFDYDEICKPISPNSVMSENFIEAYENGTLYSYLIGWSLQNEQDWSGHLPLGPAYPSTEKKISHYPKRRRRRQTCTNISWPEDVNPSTNLGLDRVCVFQYFKFRTAVP